MGKDCKSLPAALNKAGANPGERVSGELTERETKPDNFFRLRGSGKRSLSIFFCFHSR
jgi:hypothetical protein